MKKQRKPYTAEEKVAILRHLLEQDPVSKLCDDFINQFGFKLTGRRKHILHGDPGTVIPRFAANQRIDLLAMGDGGVLIGDSAERILGQVQCSVLVVKPGTFRSPVQL